MTRPLGQVRCFTPSGAITVFRALAKEKDRGKFDPALAPKAFAGLMTAAAKKYVREFGAPGDHWNLIFAPIDRRQAASHYAEEFLDWYAVDYGGPAKKPRAPRRGE